MVSKVDDTVDFSKKNPTTVDLTKKNPATVDLSSKVDCRLQCLVRQYARQCAIVRHSVTLRATVCSNAWHCGSGRQCEQQCLAVRAAAVCGIETLRAAVCAAVQWCARQCAVVS
jgi:hypothetical protein